MHETEQSGILSYFLPSFSATADDEPWPLTQGLADIKESYPSGL